jgi:hypothetical protein
VRCPRCGRGFVAGDAGRRAAEGEEEEELGAEYVHGYQVGAREEALARGPGLALELCGWITLGLFGLAYLFVAAAATADGNADAGGLLCFGCRAGVFVLPYSLAVALGGRHMRRLSSRGWAMAAIPICFGVIHGALGVWALVTLEKPLVRRAFDLPDRNRRRWSDGRSRSGSPASRRSPQSRLTSAAAGWSIWCWARSKLPCLASRRFSPAVFCVSKFKRRPGKTRPLAGHVALVTMNSYRMAVPALSAERRRTSECRARRTVPGQH